MQFPVKTHSRNASVHCECQVQEEKSCRATVCAKKHRDNKQNSHLCTVATLGWLNPDAAASLKKWYVSVLLFYKASLSLSLSPVFLCW